MHLHRGVATGGPAPSVTRPVDPATAPKTRHRCSSWSCQRSPLRTLETSGRPWASTAAVSSCNGAGVERHAQVAELRVGNDHKVDLGIGHRSADLAPATAELADDVGFGTNFPSPSVTLLATLPLVASGRLCSTCRATLGHGDGVAAEQLLVVSR